MATTPDGFRVFEAEVISVAGSCGAGHKKGDRFRMSCWDAGGLCGFFYHHIFPDLNVLQFDGTLPWAGEKTHTVQCPDRHNEVTLVIHR